MKYGRIDELRLTYPVAAMCWLLDVSESGYHAWHKRPPSRRAQANARLDVEIKAAHDERTRQTYGPERLQADLADNGIHVGIHRIKRIRQKPGLRCRQKRKFEATTDSKHSLPVAPNLFDRQFSVAAPNNAWVTDITYIATDERWLYLAGIVAASICAHAYQKFLRQFGMQASMSRKGNCWDNAPMESCWGSLKTERVHHCRFATREQAKREITEYIEIFYNRIREQARLGHLSPTAFSQQYYAMQMAA